MTKSPPVLELSDVRYRWPGRASFELQVPNMALAQGETVLLLGESGSGKSTLLSLICGTIVTQSGDVRVAGTDISSLSSGKRDRFRAEQIGLIFQQFTCCRLPACRTIYCCRCGLRRIGQSGCRHLLTRQNAYVVILDWIKMSWVRVPEPLVSDNNNALRRRAR